MKILFLLLAALAGTLLPVQASLNVKMAKFAGSPVLATLLSFFTGTIALVLYLLLREPNLNTKLSGLRTAPVYLWLPGLLGVFYIITSITLLPRLGVALTFSLLVAGQMLVTLVLDHYGLLGVAAKPVNVARVAGVLLVIAGVILIRKF